MDPFDVHKGIGNAVKLPIGQADVFPKFDSATPLNDFIKDFLREMAKSKNV